MAALGVPPSPEHYEQQYRHVAGLPPQRVRSEFGTAGEEMVAMVQALVQIVADTTDGLSGDLTRFGSDSVQLLRNLAAVEDKSTVASLMTALTASAVSLQASVDTSRRALEESRTLLASMKSELEQSRTLAQTDALTGIPNRRGLELSLAREVSRARRAGTQLSIAIIDLDHFKRVNDEHGHEVGDLALVHLAGIMKSGTRDSDVLARFGGEEFVVLLPESDGRGAHFVIDRMRILLERTPLIASGARVALRFSSGIAELQPGEPAESALRRADQALYAAKHAGRNRVLIAEARAA